MPHPIVMPSFGMYTSEGKLAGWVCADGALVTMGQTIAEIETEKAVQELPCPANGVLHQLARVGEILKEQDLLGYVLAPGEQPPAEPKEGGMPDVRTVAAAVPVNQPAAERGLIKASPIARRLAAEHRLDLASLTGTGPGGRIVEADVLAAVQNRRTPDKSAMPAVRSRAPLTPMRRAIGERLRHSIDHAVALTLTREVEADRLVAARVTTSAGREASIPFDAYFVKLLAAALRANPGLNSTVEGDELIQWDDINIGVAVSLPTGLVVPVITNADTLPLPQVGERIRVLAQRARESGLRAEDVAGGTCTITNLGAANIDGFTPVLNPPQACILGVGRIRPRATVRDGMLVIANTCVLSLTFDHRVTDGVPAAGLVDAIARFMNDDAWLAQLLEA